MDKLDLILEKLDGMEKRMDTMQDELKAMKTDLADLKEAHEETRCGVNTLLEWAEECGNVIKFPLPKVK